MAAFVTDRKAEGIRHFQLKIGGDPHEDAQRVRAVAAKAADDDVLIADANGGYRFQDALVAARLLDGLGTLHYEQPCRTMAECVRLRPLTTLPLIYDEVVHDVETLLVAAGPGEPAP